MKIETLDVSGDAGIRVTGASLEEAFVAAGIGTYELITDTGSVRESSHITLDVQADTLEALLVRYLNEIIFQFDTYAFVGSRITIEQLSVPQKQSESAASNTARWCLKAVIYGEAFDRERHEQRALIKAATYHALKVVETDGVWCIEVIFDI